MIGRIEYQTNSINSILNNNIHAFIKKLKSGDVEQNKYANKLQYHFDNNLTHDEKTEPKKEYLFKKLSK